MRTLSLVLVLICVAYVGYEIARAHYLTRVSGRLVDDAILFSKATSTRGMLVVGDSTAVGVGSRGEGTVAARLSETFDLSAENYAASGAKARDIRAQISQRQKERYDLVLIQVGGNDVIRFSPLEQLRDDITLALKDARAVSDHVVLLTAGKIGDAPFFPRAFGWVWTKRAAKVRAHFMAAAKKYDAAYVDLYSAPDPFAEDPKRYYAADGLHLTAEGYRFWFDETKKAIDEKWPDF